MTLIKTSFWAGLSVFIKILAVFITSKIIAIYTGPVGLAVIEQFQNFVQIVRIFSGGFIQQGIVKYVAENRQNSEAKSQILSSAIIFCILVSLILSMLLIVFSSDISYVLLQSIAYKKIVILFAASVILFSLNNFLLAVLNGELEIKKYVACNIVNTLSMLVLTIYLVVNAGLYGGLLALILNQSIIFFFTLFLTIRCRWFQWLLFTRGIDIASLMKLVTYAFIMIITTLSVPLSQLIIRNYVGHALSWQDAGYWQGITKLSNNYAILIDAILGIYYLPKFSGTHTMQELKQEIIRGYQFILPLALLAASLIFLFKKYVILILYSDQFLPMLLLFKYQLIGDVARISAWLLSYFMIAKTMLKYLIVTELSFLFFYPTVTVIFIHYFGLIGTTMGFALSYFLYWMLMLFFTIRYFINKGLLKNHADF